MQRFKQILIGLVIVLGFILVIQNTERVQTSFLWWNPEMPRALLLGITLLAGFIGGAIAGAMFAVHRRNPDR